MKKRVKGILKIIACVVIVIFGDLAYLSWIKDGIKEVMDK